MFKLNEKQQQALDLDSYQNVLVLAPPGSGKTSLLEQKIIKFVKEDVRYVALTFSKKSSQELSDRVSIALKNDALQRYAHTFHSYCYSLLKIYDDTFDADSFDFTSSDSFDFLITRATDLINSNVIPLSENLVFLIDEFQDTDKTQLNFMLALSDNHNTKFFVVGDPNQSIYSFRGAEVSNILNFEQQFSAVKVELNINYRSHKSIVDFSNYLIKHSSENISETDSVSFNTDTTFTRPIHCRYQNEQEEAFAILDKYYHFFMSGKKSSEFAVIARTSSLLDSFKSEIDNYKLFRKDILKNFDKVEFSKINCLTAHASKGLEFSVVVILGAEEGFFPHYNAQTSAAILDELRLFYVAVTRCKDSLLFTSVNARLTSNTARFNQTKSRYLRQMPENLLNDAHLLNVPIFEGFKVGTKVIYNDKKGRIITLLERSAICKIRGMKQGAIKYDDLQII